MLLSWIFYLVMLTLLLAMFIFLHFLNLNSLVYNLPILSKSLQCLNGLLNAAGQVMLLEWLLKWVGAR